MGKMTCGIEEYYLYEWCKNGVQLCSMLFLLRNKCGTRVRLLRPKCVDECVKNFVKSDKIHENHTLSGIPGLDRFVYYQYFG